jgi:hypothetical protein
VTTSFGGQRDAALSPQSRRTMRAVRAAPSGSNAYPQKVGHISPAGVEPAKSGRIRRCPATVAPPRGTSQVACAGVYVAFGGYKPLLWLLVVGSVLAALTAHQANRRLAAGN